MVFNKAINEWDSDEDWDGHFKNNQANSVKKAIKGLKDVERIRYVTPAEAQKFAVSLNQYPMKHLLDMVVVGCDTGLRESKIVNLREDHCDFDSERINIPDAGNEEQETVLL